MGKWDKQHLSQSNRQTPPAQRVRFYHEAQEPAEAANAALDQIERLAQVVLDAGGEVALRARLSRLLPGAGNFP